MIRLNSILDAADFDLAPKDVILLRHKDQRAEKGRTPYELWRDDRPAFDKYQSIQSIDGRTKFTRAHYWASFVGTVAGETMFVGLYRASYHGLLEEDTPKPEAPTKIIKAGTYDLYNLEEQNDFRDLAGKLFIDWGAGTRAWVQRADRQNKPIKEIRPKFQEDPFPGFLNFVEPLSRVDAFPLGWISILKVSRGIYLLTCPRTKELYVGKASGDEGFWHRWQEYIQTGHGGNVRLKSREPSDYQVSILEVAGTAATEAEIYEMEVRWKRKFQSREMGLNSN